MANPGTPSSSIPSVENVTRRTVLKGMAGVAGVASFSGFLAACSGGASPAASGGASAGASAAGSAAAGGSLTFGSNYSDAVPKKAMQDIVDAFTKETGITVKVNTVDHGTFQNQLNSYLQATPDDVFTWFSGYRMRFFAAKGLATDVSDVWGKIGSNYSDAFKVGATGVDGKQYFVPIYDYPWAVFYRNSLFKDKGYNIPKTWADYKTLLAKMKSDGLVPLAFGDKDGWPAMGTFDIINLRKNGYQFHVDLMAGKQKWTDQKVKDVFNLWKEILPFVQEGAAGRTWQDAAQALVKKQAGLYVLGMFVSDQFKTAGQTDLDDLDFFPFPDLGTEFDAEKALDAPIDGFMIASKSPNLSKDLDSAKAFLEYLGKGKTQIIFTTAAPGNIAAGKDAETSNYNALQKKAVELISGAQKITQFLDRDTRPDFAGPNAMQAFLLNFLKDPNQDLDKFLKTIQDAWDALPPQ